MSKAELGDTVEVHYTGKLGNGTIFDSSKDKEPFEFTIGGGNIIPGFESAVIGMQAGETKKENIPAEDAYGPHHEELIHVVERSMIPEDMDLGIGNHLQITQEGGEPFVVTVVEVSDENVTLDGNHPLAGQELIFEIELLKIVE